MSASTALLDTATPDGARAYDYLLGGKVSYACDREMVARIAALYPPGTPGPRELAARNRAFLERAVSGALGDPDGPGQVLDLGTGFPAPVPLHEVAAAARTGARTACVDLDARVVAHGLAATEGLAGVTYACADLTRPGDVLANRDVLSVIDPGLPVAAIFGLVLHFLPAADARRVIGGWVRRLPSGSRFVVTVASWPSAAMWERVREAYGPGPLFNHSRQEVQAMLTDAGLTGGGVEVARGWGPEVVESQGPGRILAGVGRKP